VQYFFSHEVGNDQILLKGSERRHLIKSLRKQVGDRIDVLDGKGSVFQCQISAIGRDQVLAEIKESHLNSSPNWMLHLAVAPTKIHGKMEWMVEKCTELGLARLTFIQCKRSVRPKVNLNRLNRIAISAMKQSGRFYLPKIEGPIPLQSLLSRDDLPDTRLIAHCEKREQAHMNEYSNLNQMMVLIGPEGDFTEEEITKAKAAKFTEITLGNARLRTETAGLYVTSVVNFINQ